MADEPERLDVLLAYLGFNRLDDVLQILIIRCGPHSGWRIWRGDYESILVFVIQQRKVVALPVAVRTAAVQAENERDLLSCLQIARVVEEVSAARLHLDNRPLIDHSIARTVLVRTMQKGWVGARGATQLQSLLSGAHLTEQRGRDTTQRHASDDG